jgi:hypothetical protein
MNAQTLIGTSERDRHTVDKSRGADKAACGEASRRPAGTCARTGWWQENVTTLTEGDALSRYLDDYTATGNEVEAMRLAAARAGKAEPPADWKSRYDTAPADTAANAARKNGD